MSSYMCFLCHNAVSSATNEELREKYKDIVGINLCSESHLCFICTQHLKKLSAFKTMCLKQMLEYPILFSEKSVNNYQKSDTQLMILCTEDTCQHFCSRDVINHYHSYNEEYNDNDNYHCDSNNYAELEEDENSINDDNDKIDYTDFHIDKDCDRTDKLFDNVIYNFNDETLNLNDNYNYNEELNNQLNNYSTNITENFNENFTNDIPNLNDVNNESINDNANDYYDINHFNNDNTTDNDISEQNDTINESFNDNLIDNINESNNMIEVKVNEDLTEVNENTGENIIKKSKKKKKSKKRSYEKIVLSFKEQKAVLEKQRKEKKYIEADFKCFSCALGFLFKDSYQSHMMRHEESNGQYSCNVCGLRFATQNARCMHVILHSEIYRCNKCKLEIKRPHRARHSRECWGGGGDQASCHLCGKSFKDANCLQQHLKRFHLAKTSKRTYSCNVCGNTYTEQSAVRAHMIKHVNRRFDCKHCKSSFASPYTLAQHMKTHTKDPYTAIQSEEYSCMTCNTSYKSRKNLLAHYRNTLAHQQTSFECTICSRNCPNARALAAHTETHTTNTPHTAPQFQCPYCGVSRASRRLLMRHARAHREGKGVGATAVCHLCGAVFKGKNKLTRHLKEVCERARMEEAMATFYEQSDLQI